MTRRAFLALTSFLTLAIAATPASQAAAGSCGDVDGNGVVAASDALLTLQHATGSPVELACDEAGGDLAERVAALEELLAHVELDGDTLRLVGVNLQIVSGSGTTDGVPEDPCRRDADCPDDARCTDFGTCVVGNGVGNLIIGYDEADDDDLKIGSHNLVIGRLHTYTGYAAIVAGENNAVGAAASAVTGGRDNMTTGDFASVTGGTDNLAEDEASSVVGGRSNTAGAPESTVTGGVFNRTRGSTSAVCGGQQNVAQGFASSVLGGRGNDALGRTSSIVGGMENVTSATGAVVVSGQRGRAAGTTAVVVGGEGFRTSTRSDITPVTPSFP